MDIHYGLLDIPASYLKNYCLNNYNHMFFRAIYYLLICSLISSCIYEKQKVEKAPVAIAEEYIVRSITIDDIKKNSGDTISFIGVQYYYDYNITLIDSLSDIFFHKKRFYCETPPEELNENTILPSFRYLKPVYFEHVNHTDSVLRRVLAQRANPIYIVHNRDTIRDERYFRLKRALKSNNISVVTRLLTEEEEAVLSSILNNKKYKPEEIEWKRTRIVPDKSLLRKFRRYIETGDLRIMD